MGAYREDYLVVGVDILDKIKEMAEEEIEELENIIYKKCKLKMIREQFQNSYCVVGKILRYSDESQDISKPFEIDSIELEKICAEVKPILDKVLNENTTPKLLAFTHYS